MPKSLVLIVACGVAAFSQAAQTKVAPRKGASSAPKPDPDNIPLAAIQVSGNKFYTAKQVIGAAGVSIGQPMKQAGFDAMKTRLEQTGAFEVVSYRYDPTPDGRGYALRIEVVEELQLLHYRFEDLPATDAELRKILEQKQPLFAVRIPPSRTILDQFAATLTDFLAAKNFKDTVAGKVVAESPELTIVFGPSTPQAMVGQFAFTGNKAIDISTLANAFAPVVIGTSSKEKDVRALLESGLRPVYEAKGYMRVAFGKIESETMKEADGVALTFAITEGPQFKFGDIRVTGSGLTNKEALAEIEMKPGAAANMDLAAAGVKRLKERLHHYGYMAGNVTFDRKINDKALTVDVTFKLDPGPRYTMGDLKITGLDINSEPFIRKMWGMNAGRPYNSDYPQHFLDEIKSQGLFDNLKGMRYEDKPNKADQTVDVMLYFVGGSDKPIDRRRRRDQD